MDALVVEKHLKIGNTMYLRFVIRMSIFCKKKTHTTFSLRHYRRTGNSPTEKPDIEKQNEKKEIEKV